MLYRVLTLRFFSWNQKLTFGGKIQITLIGKSQCCKMRLYAWFSKTLCKSTSRDCTWLARDLDPIFVDMMNSWTLMLSPFSPCLLALFEMVMRTTKRRMRMIKVSNKIVIDLAPKITFFFWRKTYLDLQSSSLRISRSQTTQKSMRRRAKMQKRGVGLRDNFHKWKMDVIN